MIVVDASALLELLLRTTAGRRIETRLFSASAAWHAPHLIDLEVAQVLRRYVRARELSPARALQAVDDLLALPLTRYPHDVLLPRIWELRHNASAYDAAYVALAEVLDAPLLTRDARLASFRGHEARVELV